MARAKFDINQDVGCGPVRVVDDRVFLQAHRQKLLLQRDKAPRVLFL